MGKIRQHPPVKLIVGMIAVNVDLFASAERLLSERFGNIDFHSKVMPFDYTDYYLKEMGDNLLRKFISFEKLIQPDELAGVKIFTNSLEGQFFYAGTKQRVINLDPGYVSAAKLVLASTKDHIHRIYLIDGIFAEITLQMLKGSFRPWQWTYPDYRSDEYIAIFNEIRQMYMDQLHNSGISPHSI